jgi:hypothetical protein
MTTAARETAALAAHLVRRGLTADQPAQSVFRWAIPNRDQTPACLGPPPDRRWRLEREGRTAVV